MFKCLRPRFVKNRYSGEDVIANCGKCEMCASNKGDKYSQLCQLMAHQYKYCMFVTLTYAPKYLPTCSADIEYIPEQRVVNKYIGDKVIPAYYRYHFYSDCERTGEAGELISEYDSSGLEEFEQLENLMHLGSNTFGYCSMRDLQNFHKSFRSNAFRLADKFNLDNKNEICSYKHFTVFDFGGRRLRPHYHAIFCFNSDFLACEFGEILLKTWKFGRVSFELSRGKADQYVARYVNSLVLVPGILKTGKFKVRQTHSVGLVQGLFKGCKQEIYESDLRRACEIGVVVGEKADTLQLKGFVSSVVFPKCLQASRSTYDELYQLLTILRPSLQYSSYAKQRVGWRDFQLNNYLSLAEFLSFEFVNPDCKAPVVAYLRSIYSDKEHIAPAYRLKIQDFLYRLLLVSKKFFDLLDETSGEFLDSSEHLVKLRVRQIYEFYYLNEMRKLREWYEEINEKLNDSALWLTVFFLYDRFLTRRCRFKDSLFQDKFFIDFLGRLPVGNDNHIDLSRLSLVNDLEFRNRYVKSQIKMIRYIKHRQLYNLHFQT